MNCMDQTHRWKRKSENYLKYLCGAHGVPGMNPKNHMKEQHKRKKVNRIYQYSLSFLHMGTHTHTRVITLKQVLGDF